MRTSTTINTTVVTGNQTVLPQELYPYSSVLFSDVCSHGRWSKNIISCKMCILLRWDNLSEADPFIVAAAALLLASCALRYLPPYVGYLAPYIMSSTKLLYNSSSINSSTNRIFDEGIKSHPEVARTQYS